MAQDICIKLYQEFYHDRQFGTNSDQASSHWKKLSQHFNIETDSNGLIQSVKGYGFGGSGDKRMSATIMSAVEIFLQQIKLSYRGLAAEKNKGKKLVESMGLAFSRDAFRQVCTEYFLRKKIAKAGVEVKNILIIGDGHGILAALMSEQYPDANIFLIDLGVTLFFQAYYLESRFTDKQHILLAKGNRPTNGNGFYYCPAERLNDFPLVELDLAINVASMQEMDMAEVNHYFRMMRERKTVLFYCCNRLEKILPDGHVTRFFDYPWRKDDVHLVDEKCPWHQFFLSRSTAPNLKLLNLIPIPLLHRYDGVHWHRLTQFSH